MEKMEISDQDSHLALIVPVACIYKSLFGMFSGDRASGQSQEYQPRGGIERKHPFSPLLSS